MPRHLASLASDPTVPRLSRLLVAIASLLLLGLFTFPLWRIDLIAPQYPEGLGMLIRINTVTGIKPNDLESINGLNHYIGMKAIVPDTIPELRYMPWIVGGLIVLGLATAAIGRRGVLTAWLGAFVALAAAGLADFWRWEQAYGRDLDLEHAIIKVPGMTYEPPLIGTKQLLNFTATSWPDLGALLAFAAFALGAAGLFIAIRHARASRPETVSMRVDERSTAHATSISPARG
jgi:hypothetical protein